MSIEKILSLRIQWYNTKSKYESNSVTKEELIKIGKKISKEYLGLNGYKKKYDDALDIIQYLIENK
ncbi:MAG: hypothetical protein PHN56_06485 [Candidatus Nanoarchaeia archaeon]|nr:hypothetical protein [Candidatus Nanoarchaeia archaeon]